jgi:serine/threonine protein kinase
MVRGSGHLDLKPGNIVVRDGDEAVLVDFGLAGRHLRPGRGSGPYGAPEVWGAIPKGWTPMAADVYAFGCVAYEVLTGHILFDAPNEVVQIGMHIAHDGMPAALGALAKDKALEPLVKIMKAALRRDPRDRPNVADVREALRKVAPQYAKAAWPGTKLS